MCSCIIHYMTLIGVGLRASGGQDPDVLAIKQTLPSRQRLKFTIIAALIRRRNQPAGSVLVELKARFGEKTISSRQKCWKGRLSCNHGLVGLRNTQ